MYSKAHATWGSGRAQATLLYRETVHRGLVPPSQGPQLLPPRTAVILQDLKLLGRPPPRTTAPLSSAPTSGTSAAPAASPQVSNVATWPRPPCSSGLLRGDRTPRSLAASSSPRPPRPRPRGPCRLGETAKSARAEMRQMHSPRSAARSGATRSWPGGPPRAIPALLIILTTSAAAPHKA